MKRFCFLFVTFLLVFGLLWAEEPVKSGNMASFMGLKWGISKADYDKNFKANFKAIRKEFKRILDLRSMEVFKSPVSLVFSDPSTGENSIDEEDNKKSKSGNLVLSGVTIKIDPEKFEDLFDVLKFRYGQPTSYNESKIQNAYGAILIQKEATWDNEPLGRSIIMMKFGVFLSQGEIQFTRFMSEEEKQRERERLMKEREERLKKAAALL